MRRGRQGNSFRTCSSRCWQPDCETVRHDAAAALWPACCCACEPTARTFPPVPSSLPRYSSTCDFFVIVLFLLSSNIDNLTHSRRICGGITRSQELEGRSNLFRPCFVLSLLRPLSASALRETSSIVNSLIRQLRKPLFDRLQPNPQTVHVAEHAEQLAAQFAANAGVFGIA